MATGNSNNRRNNKGTGWGIAVVVAAVLISNLAERLDGFRPPRMGFSVVTALLVVVIVLAFAIVALAVYKTVKTRRTEADSVESYTSVRRAASKQDSSGFDAANSGYSRDRARRQAQLDSFLKNGIIDRAEYLVLVDRYKKEENQF